MDVADIDGDGNADIVMVVRDNTATNQYIQVYKGPDPTLLTAQQTLAVPLTTGLYTNMILGHYGETVTGEDSQVVAELAIVKILIFGF